MLNNYTFYQIIRLINLKIVSSSYESLKVSVKLKLFFYITFYFMFIELSLHVEESENFIRAYCIYLIIFAVDLADESIIRLCSIEKT